MRFVTLRAFASAILALLAVTSIANAQQECVYTIPHYKFETSQEMDNVKIAYVTYGKLNADNSNAVLLVPGTGSRRHWAIPMSARARYTTPTNTSSSASEFSHSRGQDRQNSR
jgi:hypothetical protein